MESQMDDRNTSQQTKRQCIEDGVNGHENDKNSPNQSTAVEGIGTGIGVKRQKLTDTDNEILTIDVKALEKDITERLLIEASIYDKAVQRMIEFLEKYKEESAALEYIKRKCTRLDGLTNIQTLAKDKDATNDDGAPKINIDGALNVLYNVQHAARLVQGPLFNIVVKKEQECVPDNSSLVIHDPDTE